jgi:hypothetical protein
MAIVFEANYSKKLGLPGYSSHQYNVTVRVELADMGTADDQCRATHNYQQQQTQRKETTSNAKHQICQIPKLGRRKFAF